MQPILHDFDDVIETQRLLLRGPRPGDGKELRAAISDSINELKEWMPWATGIPTEEEAEENVRNAFLKFLKREDLRLNIYLKGTETLVGCSGLHRIDWSVPKFEIGYWCRTTHTRQGYIREAVEAIERFSFETLKAKRLEIRCDPLNIRSRRIPEVLGYQLEGTFRNDDRSTNGELRDTMIFAKTDTD